MTMNPRDYDLDELDGGGSFDAGNGSSGEGRVTADDVVHSNQYRELMKLEAMSDGLEKPYLSNLPDAYSGEVEVFEWLEYLVDMAGFKGALEALRYYRTIGWITEDVEETLVDYLRSFDDPQLTSPSGLSRADHQLSLVYVAKLTAMD